MSEEENGRVTWRKLESGCAYGLRLFDRVTRVEESMEEDKLAVKELGGKMDKLIFALVTATISLALAAVTLFLNLIVP